MYPVAYWWQSSSDYYYLDVFKYEYFSNGNYKLFFANKSSALVPYQAVDNATATERNWVEEDGTRSAYWSPPYWRWQFDVGYGLYYSSSAWNYGMFNH